MSMSRGCFVVRKTNDEWYIIVAQKEYDYDFEDFSIYGPGTTEEKAWDKFAESNPGSSQQLNYDQLPDFLQKALDKYIKNGYKNPPFITEQVPYTHRNW